MEGEAEDQEESMKCHVCGGKMAPVLSDLHFKLGRKTIVIVKELPVLQCERCSEYMLDDHVMARVDAMIGKVEEDAELKVLKYAALGPEEIGSESERTGKPDRRAGWCDAFRGQEDSAGSAEPAHPAPDDGGTARSGRVHPMAERKDPCRGTGGGSMSGKKGSGGGKKRATRQKAKKRKKDVPGIPALPDRRAMEGMMAGFFGGGKDDAVGRAQALMYDAWETSSPGRRVALALKALEISPDCADAFVLLAEEAAETLGEAIALYRKGVEAGERAIGEKDF